MLAIIPYQVITGNYNIGYNSRGNVMIIPYQVITGNYNLSVVVVVLDKLYHTK